MSVELLLDAPALSAAEDRLVRNYLSAGTRAVANATRRLEKRLEGATQGAVPGKLWRAWQSNTFPRSGPARNPVGTIYVKGGARIRGAIEFWTQPGVVRGRRGQFLAIPTPAAGARGRGRQSLTPSEWERKTGKRLILLQRAGRAAVLVVPELEIRAAPRRRHRKGGSKEAGPRVVAIFVLIPAVNHRNAFAIEPLVEAAREELVQDFYSEVSKVRG